MSINYGDLLEEVYESSKQDIENELWPMVRVVNDTAFNQCKAKPFFDMLRQRMTSICDDVRAIRMAEIMNQYPHTFDSIDQVMNEPNKVVSVKTCNRLGQDLDMVQLDVKSVNKEGASSLFGTSIDSLLEFHKAHSAKRRKVDMKDQKGAIDTSTVTLPFEPIRVKIPGVVTRLTTEMAKKLRLLSDAILRATQDPSGQIRAMCFVCERRWEMDFDAWHSHLLEHTNEEKYNCNTSTNDLEQCNDICTSSDLTAFVCCICNYLQFDRHRINVHLTEEHNKSDSEIKDCIQRVILLPNLRPIATPIATKYKYVLSTQRYSCGMRDCSKRSPSPSMFKKHFMQHHQHIDAFNCPHCSEIIENQSNPNDFFGSIIQHFFAHSSIVNQCPACDSIFANDYHIIRHLLTAHKTNIVKFRRDIRKGNLIQHKHEVLIMFDCSLCDCCFDALAPAIRHYMQRHNSHHADFTMKQFVKETDDQGVTKYAALDNGHTWKFQQHFECGLCHDIYKTKEGLCVHYRSTHSSQPLIMEFSTNYIIDAEKVTLPVQNVNFDQFFMYFCAHCTDYSHSGTFYSKADEVYEHWRSYHAKKVFQFTVAPLAYCHYCDVISTFNGLEKHHAKQHPTKSFAIENLFDRLKCGLCLDHDARSADNMPKHFNNQHLLVLNTDLFNLIALADDMLQKLIKIKGHKKYKCDYCDDFFDTKDDYHKHHGRKHYMLKERYTKLYDNESIYLITGCCNTKLHPVELFNHFKTHAFSQIGLLKKFYWETMVVFGNGLVLNKHNLLGTEHDDSKEFAEFIGTFVAKK